MSVTQDQVVDYIKNLKLGEVKALIETLEAELGVSASAPMMAMPMAGGGEGAAPAEEQTEFDVILTSFGENKIPIIKVVRALTGLNLKDAKALVDGVPAKLKEAVSKEDAESAKAQITEAGGVAEIK